jgi:hypothetical protein
VAGFNLAAGCQAVLVITLSRVHLLRLLCVRSAALRTPSSASNSDGNLSAERVIREDRSSARVPQQAGHVEAVPRTAIGRCLFLGATVLGKQDGGFLPEQQRRALIGRDLEHDLRWLCRHRAVAAIGQELDFVQLPRELTTTIETEPSKRADNSAGASGRPRAGCDVGSMEVRSANQIDGSAREC